MEKELSKFYTLLRDPARRKIIELLGEREKIGFKELRETLGLGVGTVYYHLDMLSGFIVQDKQHKYMLNDRGQALYRVLREGFTLPAIESCVSNRSLFRWLFLSPIFAKTFKPLKLLPFSIIMILIGAVGSAYARLDPALFFYVPYSTRSVAEIIIRYFLGWFGLFLFGEAFSYIVYKRVGNSVQFLTCLGIASLPLMIYPYIYWALSILLFDHQFLDLNLLFQAIFIVFELWALLLLSSAICFGKGLRLDKAIIISLAAMYMNIAVLYFMGWFR